jgi:hypothetical protein
MSSPVESVLISAAATSIGVLVIAALAGAALRIFHSAGRASRDGGYGTRAPRPSHRPKTRGRLLRFGAEMFTVPRLSPRRLRPGQARRWPRRPRGLTSQGQVTDRFEQAITQLGSDELEVRTRSIYALCRSARDPGVGHPAVLDALATFVRKHSREQWPVPGHGNTPVAGRATRPDVQAALTVIGRWDTDDRRTRIDLTLADLTGANLIGADLADSKLTGTILAAADLTGAELSGADLVSANLTGAKLTRAKLTRAKLTGAALTGARLGAAHLNGADLRRADLTAAGLQSAHLAGADLSGADLTRANLAGADLSGADLTRANLTDARWTEGSPAPAGWARHPGSGLLTQASVAVGDSG